VKTASAVGIISIAYGKQKGGNMRLSANKRLSGRVAARSSESTLLDVLGCRLAWRYELRVNFLHLQAE
jgi:hypothetical protein